MNPCSESAAKRGSPQELLDVLRSYATRYNDARRQSRIATEQLAAYLAAQRPEILLNGATPRNDREREDALALFRVTDSAYQKHSETMERAENVAREIYMEREITVFALRLLLLAGREEETDGQVQ